MSGVSSDFERFLYANYPDDYRRATAKDVPEDVLTAILSRHKGHYDVWKQVPEWIKNKYHDILPREVLNGNDTVKHFVKEQEQKKQKDEKETSALIDYSVTLLALGYAADTVKALTENRMQREALLKAVAGGEFTPEQKRLWLETRERDKEAIMRDWSENQPEKYLFHLFKEINRGKRRSERAKTADERTAALSGVSKAEQELAKLLPFFENTEARKKLAGYLRQKTQQAALGHMTPEVLAVFSDKMKSLGISVTPFNRDKQQERVENRESLAESLKQNFQRRVDMETLLRTRYSQKNTSFSRISPRDVLQTREGDDVSHMLSLRREAATRQGA